MEKYDKFVEALRGKTVSSLEMEDGIGHFPSSCLLPLQNESKCEAFLVKISFHSYVK